MGKCSVKCPTVRKQLRAAVAEAPWLVDEVFPQRKLVDSKFPVTKDKPKRVIEPAEKLVQEPIISEKTKWHDEEINFVEQRELIIERTIEQDERKDDFVEERELIVERVAERDDEVDFVEKRELVVERVDKNKIDRITQPAAIPETRTIQEVPITKQTNTIPDEMIEVTETRKSVINKTILEQAKEVPLANKKAEIIGNKINRTTTPVKFEVKHREKEEDDEFIDEELQKPLDKNNQNHRNRLCFHQYLSKFIKIFTRKDAKIDRKELAGPSVSKGPRQVEVQDERTTPITSAMETDSRESPGVSAPAESPCDDTCPLIKQQKERIMRKLEERQRIVDHYYLTRGFSYFGDVCTCSLACMLYTLSRDQFVRSIFASLALFAVGLKLCSELDAWEMPRRVS